MADEHVQPQDPALRNSPQVANRADVAVNVGIGIAPAEPVICYWNDKKYSDGSYVCDNHRRSECWNGKWVDVGNC